LRRYAPAAIQVGPETGQPSNWLTLNLRRRGLHVVCLDARHAKAALSLQINKTDANDAYGLAQTVRTGWYREVTVKSMDVRTLKMLLVARAQLVAQRQTTANKSASSKPSAWLARVVPRVCFPSASARRGAINRRGRYQRAHFQMRRWSVARLFVRSRDGAALSVFANLDAEDMGAGARQADRYAPRQSSRRAQARRRHAPGLE
jgi:hypothetical protein